MSRVYNMLTGNRQGGSATSERTEDPAWSNAEETPFVEIGGPGGPVFSAPAPSAVRPLPEARIEAKAEPVRSFPRLVATPAPAYMSVRFHDIYPRGVARPADGPDHTLVALHAPDHPISHEYRTLRTEIRKQLPDTASRVLLLCAVAPEAGTTTVLLNLAITLAQDAKVLVVDANLARPVLAARLAAKPGPGLCEVLAQQVPLAWAVQPVGIGGLHLLSAGASADAAPRAVSDDLPRLLSQLRQWFDWVLVDGGVWGAMPERDAACPAADAVYLVTRETDAERPEFLNIRGWVKELGGLLRGYVTTRI